MPKFSVNAAHIGSGREIEFELDAEDLIDAQNQASNMGFATSSVKPVEEPSTLVSKAQTRAIPPSKSATTIDNSSANSEVLPLLSVQGAVIWIFVVAVGTMCGAMLTAAAVLMLVASARSGAIGG